MTPGLAIFVRLYAAIDWVTDKLLSRFVLGPAASYLLLAAIGHAPFHTGLFAASLGTVLLLAALNRYTRRARRREQEALDRLVNPQLERRHAAAPGSNEWLEQWAEHDTATAQDAAEAERRFRELESRDHADS
jgi:hypothetical protein